MALIHNLWDWTASNGSASAWQTRTAYAAISGKGRTGSFSHLVWNDLVDAANGALTAAGQTWDARYTSYAGAKIPQYGELTAEKFNSVRHNIGKVFSWDWQWHYDENAPRPLPWAWQETAGYTGRLDMRGAADVGLENADPVYGWYIYELSRKLNLMIQLLSGEGPTDALTHTGLVSPADDISLLVRSSARLESAFPFSAEVDLRFTALPLSPLASAGETGAVTCHAEFLAKLRAILAHSGDAAPAGSHTVVPLPSDRLGVHAEHDTLLSSSLPVADLPSDCLTANGSISVLFADSITPRADHSDRIASTGAAEVSGSVTMRTWEFPYEDAEGYLVIPQSYLAAIDGDYLVIQ